MPAPGEENANLLPQSSCGSLSYTDSGSSGCPRRARAARTRPAAPGSSLLGKCGKRALNSTTSLPHLCLPLQPRHRSPRCRRPRVEAQVLCCLFALLAGSLLAEHPKLLDNCHCHRRNHSVTRRDWSGPALSKRRLSPLGTTVSEHHALLASRGKEGRGLEARIFWI